MLETIFVCVWYKIDRLLIVWVILQYCHIIFLPRINFFLIQDEHSKQK